MVPVHNPELRAHLYSAQTLDIIIYPDAGRGSSIGSMSSWHARGPEFIPISGPFFCGDLVMKKFLRPFSSSDSRRAVVNYGQKNVHQVLVNCLGGLPRNSVVGVTDRAWNDPKMCWRAVNQKSNQKDSTQTRYRHIGLTSPSSSLSAWLPNKKRLVHWCGAAAVPATSSSIEWLYMYLATWVALFERRKPCYRLMIKYMKFCTSCCKQIHVSVHSPSSREISCVDEFWAEICLPPNPLVKIWSHSQCKRYFNFLVDEN